ncbi:hypothetical protein KTS45_10480 [Halomicroarcula limicola]|uniref:Cyclase n=1 Tax=Haloarcula limicola TaxID=1429915 RepID=A0A8J7YDQ0_9EURY|nr:cyclase [Halomicroarcula limicola]MBV0924623.1 hypothetical protein [Halomicroarcula limicola]
MAYILVRHDVENFDEWKPHFDDHDDFRVESGQQSYQLYRTESDPNALVMLFEFDTMANARSFAQSDDLREKMTEAGVQGEPEIAYLEQIAAKTGTEQSA